MTNEMEGCQGESRFHSFLNSMHKSQIMGIMGICDGICDVTNHSLTKLTEFGLP